MQLDEHQFVESLDVVKKQIVVTTNQANRLVDHLTHIPKQQIALSQDIPNCLTDMAESLKGLEVWYDSARTMNSFFDYKRLDEVLGVRKELDALKAALTTLKAMTT